MGENKAISNVEVVIVSSKLEPQVDAGVKRALMAHMASEFGTRRIVDALPHGFHYIFKYKRMGKDGEMETRFHVEVRSDDISECYAEAKMKQLENFPDLSHTGGETVGAVREMLKVLADDQVAEDFYSEFDEDIPIVVIDDDAAVWLRDEYGIAPWYGGLRFPMELTVYADRKNGEVTEICEIDSALSGFEYDQEDNYRNVFLTRIILGVFAKAWAGTEVLSLKLDKLLEDPATGSVVRLTGLKEVIRPHDDD